MGQNERLNETPDDCKQFDRVVSLLRERDLSDEEWAFYFAHENSCTSGRHAPEALERELGLRPSGLIDGDPARGLLSEEELLRACDERVATVERCEESDVPDMDKAAVAPPPLWLEKFVRRMTQVFHPRWVTSEIIRESTEQRLRFADGSSVIFRWKVVSESESVAVAHVEGSTDLQEAVGRELMAQEGIVAWGHGSRHAAVEGKAIRTSPATLLDEIIDAANELLEDSRAAPSGRMCSMEHITEVIRRSAHDRYDSDALNSLVELCAKMPIRITRRAFEVGGLDVHYHDLGFHDLAAAYVSHLVLPGGFAPLRRALLKVDPGLDAVEASRRLQSGAMGRPFGGESAAAGLGAVGREHGHFVRRFFNRLLRRKRHRTAFEVLELLSEAVAERLRSEGTADEAQSLRDLLAAFDREVTDPDLKDAVGYIIKCLP